MKLRWAAALLVLTGLGTASARAEGFGFTVANATVVNNDANGNGKADVNETFTVTDAPFASFRSNVPTLQINDNDLNRYFVSLTGTVVEVSGNKVRYTGSFTVSYKGPFLQTDIESGTFDMRALFDLAGSASLTGTLMADLGMKSSDPKFSSTDFGPYNPGRFFGVYTPDPGGATGKISCNANAGSIGFAASMSNATVENGDENHNGKADVDETFTMTAPLSSYVSVGAPPLLDNDLNRYSLKFTGKVVSVNGAVVGYSGTFALIYNDGSLFANGLTIETGTFALTADYNESSTGAAKLRAQLNAKPGFETSEQAWANTDYAIFNPATFTGTYQPNAGGTTGTASGSLIGGVLGFSASIADGTVVNNDANGNGIADVGETFHAVGPLAAYMGIGAPDLQDRDLARYAIILDGTAVAVNGNVVRYTGDFRITYTDPGLLASIETGTFDITATFVGKDALLDGTLVAKAGGESAVFPFNTTDYAPFNPARFTGYYSPVGNGASGTLRGGLQGGTMTQAIQSRRLGSVVEGSPTAATRTDDKRVAIAASGSTVFVIDPKTGNDIVGPITVDGKVLGRAAVLHNDAYVGTDKGAIYKISLMDGSVASGKPLGADAKIYTAPAVVDHVISGLANDYVVIAASLNGGSVVATVDTTNLNAAVTQQSLGGGITTSSPSVPYANTVVVGSNAGVYTFRFPNLEPVNAAPVAAVTSPLVVGGTAYVGTGTGSTLSKIDITTGAVTTAAELGSPLMLGAFYEKRTNLVQAGTYDGRIVSFDPTGNAVGLTLAGLFNNSNTGGSSSMPVEANNIIYRATENLEILSGTPLNGNNQQVISVLSPVRGAMAATGQTPDQDYILGSSQDGLLHMVGVR